MKIYAMHPDDPLCKGEIRHINGALQGLGFDGWMDPTTGVTATFRPTRLIKGEKSASSFRAAAFQGQDGTVYETGPFHDVDALPKGVEVSAEGFVDREGKFHTRAQAAELLHFDHPPQSEELDLKKAEGDKPGGPTWLHGTSGKALRQAAKGGVLVPGGLNAKTKQGKGWTDPMVGHVYLTKDPKTALKYADWKAWDVHNHPESAVAVVKPDLSKCVPDEDWLGQLVLHSHWAHHPDAWSNQFTPHELWPEIKQALQGHRMLSSIEKVSEYDADRVPHQARIGKGVIAALKERNPQLLAKITSVAPSLAHFGPLPIVSAHVQPRPTQPNGLKGGPDVQGYRKEAPETWASQFTKIPVERQKLNKSFSEAAGNYLGQYSPKQIQAQEIESRLRDHKETLEGMATVGGQHPAFMVAARMAGHPADAELRQKAEEELGDDVVGVALAAHGLDPHDESLRMSIEAAIQELRLTKSEFNVSVLPRTVMPGQDGAEHMAMVIRRAFASNLVYEVRLGGKHSAGTAVAFDREADRFWLLKPGSGRVSPALGVSDVPYSQSRREAAFAQAARSYESMRDFYPECWLLVVDGIETACMEVMGPGYRPAQKYGDAAELIKPYQDTLDIYRWAWWDWVLGNPDDHGGNVLVTEDARVALIDHGSSLAGNSFNPPADPEKSFIPYYLRVNNPIDWTTASPAERYRCFPMPTPEERDTLKAWFKGLGARWEGVLEALAPQALPAAKARAERILNAEDPADALLRTWAGLEITHELKKGEGEQALLQSQWNAAMTNYRFGEFLRNLHDDTAIELAKKFDASGQPKPELKVFMKQVEGAYKQKVGDLIQNTSDQAMFVNQDNVSALRMLAGDGHADLLSHRYADMIRSQDPTTSIRAIKAAHHMPYVLAHASDPHVLGVLRAASENKQRSIMREIMISKRQWAHGRNFSQEFVDWAASEPEAHKLFTADTPELINKLRPEQVKSMIAGGLQSPDLLWAPQLTNEEAAERAARLDPYSDTVATEEVARLRGAGSTIDPRTFPDGRQEAIHKAMFQNPRLSEGLRNSLAMQGSFDMTENEVNQACSKGYSHPASIIVGQMRRNPNRTDLDNLACRHAAGLMAHLGEDPQYSEDVMRHPGYRAEQGVYNWFNRLKTDPKHRPDFEDAATREFWHNYEEDVTPHHFAVIEKHNTQAPGNVKIDFFHRGLVGESDNHPMVTSPALDAHAQEVQKAVLKDHHAVIKDIGGKPHVLVYRGVSGAYAGSIMQQDTFDAKTFKFPNAQMSSWSGWPQAAHEFANRSIGGQAPAGIVIRRWMPVEDILHSGCHIIHPTQKFAHPREHELIFRHRPGDTHMEVEAKDIHVTRFPMAHQGKEWKSGVPHCPLHTATEPMHEEHDAYVEEHHGLARKPHPDYGRIGNISEDHDDE